MMRTAAQPAIYSQITWVLLRNKPKPIVTTITEFHESITQQLSFEWSHTRVSSTDVKVSTTLYSIINSTT